MGPGSLVPCPAIRFSAAASVAAEPRPCGRRATRAYLTVTSNCTVTSSFTRNAPSMTVGGRMPKSLIFMA
jgi:hypothetical protein